MKHLKTIGLLLLVFSPMVGESQTITELDGKLRINQLDTDNDADSLLVKLPDGTLGLREAGSINGASEAGNNIQSKLYFGRPTLPAYESTEQAKLTAPDAAAGDSFGVSVSISGEYAIVGTPLDDDGGANSGSAYVFVRSGSTWTQQAKLTASDAAAGDQFGRSVSISGNYAIIGSVSNDDGGSNPGSAYVFVRSGSIWTQQAKLTAFDAAIGDQFGFSVSISGDYAIVGAIGDDDGGANSGSAYVFVRSGSTWTQQAKLTASDAAAGDQFGHSVSISGVYAIVGAWFGNDGGSDSGSAYVFVRSGSTWTQQAKLSASDAASNDLFGWSVSIFGDYAVIGAPYDDDSGFDSGSAYVFVRSGSTWTQQAKLAASDAAAGDNFGFSVSISGVYAIVGACSDNEGGSDSGSAYVFVRSGSTWTQQAKLTASDAALNDLYGVSVSISGDYAIVGAHLGDDGGSDSGSAYIY
ncbi:MAG: FG-GAP repeat protein [Bacteroidota bacterium]